VANFSAIKVLIGSGGGIEAYPDFGQIVVLEGELWSKYIERAGYGWHYDSCCGHAVDTPDSPYGQWQGVLIIPKVFADEALEKFPEQVIALDEVELTDFWNNHAHSLDPDINIDEGRILIIIAKRLNNERLSDADEAALDPDNLMSGVRKNKVKQWADFKAQHGITLNPLKRP